ncbi:MAG: bile acid:sodium symporter [Leptospiraceae bacterium]|nr:bile acid:sodium symporter [Leptospiraceae bacterium]
METKIPIICLSVFSMLTIGLKIEKNKLFNDKLFFYSVGIGLIINFLLLPVLALMIGNLFSLSKEHILGLYLCAICPGGSSGAFFVLRANGNPNLAGVLTSFMSIGNILITPVLFSLFTGNNSSFDPRIMLKLFLTTLLVQGIPLFLGVLIQAMKKNSAPKIAKLTGKLAMASLLAAMVILTFKNYSLIFSFSMNAWFSVFLVLTFAILSGFLGIGLDESSKGTISMVSGIKSLSTALLLTEIFVQNPNTNLIILLYGLNMYWFSELGSRVWKRKKHDF